MRRLRLSALPAAILVLSNLALGSAPPSAAQTAPRAGGPSARARVGLATDPLGGVVLFGGLFIDGQGNVEIFGDTWVFDGAWTEHHPAYTPAPLDEPVMAYDAARRETVLFGGFDGTNLRNDTWTWDGVDWTLQAPATSPPAGCCKGMAHDEVTRKVVLFDEDSTWTWDGTNWTEEHPLRSPRQRGYLGMAGSVRHVVLFGGESCVDICFYPRDTWNWNGTTWTKRRLSTSPVARARMAMAENISSRLTVLFGGWSENTPPFLFDDTWIWDGNVWAMRNSPTKPPAREYASLAYLPASRLLVLFGGLGDAGYLADTWTWDGATWACIDGCA
jgi:hypothetical protein